nr:hypothetical protein CFP56_54356 [Quercus suber]
MSIATIFCKVRQVGIFSWHFHIVAFPPTSLVRPYVLSAPCSSLSNNNMFSDNRLGRSCSSSAFSTRSNGTVQRKKIRSFSNSSITSLGSILASSDIRLGSTSTFDFDFLNNNHDPPIQQRAASTSVSEYTRQLSGFVSPTTDSNKGANSGRLESKLLRVQNSEDDTVLTGEPESTIQPSEIVAPPPSPLPPLPPSPEYKTFARWVSTLRRKKSRPPQATTTREQRWELDDFGGGELAPDSVGALPTSPATSRSSSLGFVTAMRSATVTVASTSIAAMSRQGSKLRHGRQLSLTSGSLPRSSIDTRRSSIDKAAKQRSRKRREKLEELIRTEESYVADVKALSDAYFTLLGHHETTTSFTRASTRRTIANLLHLHDDILGLLHQTVPFAEYDQSVAKLPRPPMTGVHTRWHSVDVVPRLDTPGRSKLATIRNGRRSLNISRSDEEERATLRCSPQLVARVAKIFHEHMERFQAYEEFGARYDLVQRDIDEAQHTLLAWQDYDRAIEAISSTVNPVKSREANRKKALTIKDLLIKRLPRYELLFSDLCNFTPVCDDPESHAVVDTLLRQLKHTCQRMNLAKACPTKARMIQVTWLVGDRLSYSGQLPRSIYLGLLGAVVLCGCLYVAYRSRDGIRGFYAICILFDSTMLIATAEEEQQRYYTKAGITLSNATVEETDNGKGLQCHTAPHSWKIVFEHSGRMYEIIFTACSAPEAFVWRQNITKQIEIQSQAVEERVANAVPLHSPLIEEMRSVGNAFGKPSSFVRRMSVHRTATVGPTTEMNQVVITNTQAEKENVASSSHSSLQIPRSQSVFTPSHIQKLAPHRADRTRLEALLADVWTREKLPYPGMTRRDSTRAFVRKFSMASITSNFSSTKRNASYSSIQQARKEEMPPPNRLAKSSVREPPKSPRPQVNFHSTPDAFLPADFGLQDPAKKKRSALRTFTMTMERPFSPLLGKDDKPSIVRRAQSVRDVPSKPIVHDSDGNMMSTATLPTYSVPQDREMNASSLHDQGSTVLDMVDTMDDKRLARWVALTAATKAFFRCSNDGNLRFQVRIIDEVDRIYCSDSLVRGLSVNRRCASVRMTFVVYPNGTPSHHTGTSQVFDHRSTLKDKTLHEMHYQTKETISFISLAAPKKQPLSSVNGAGKIHVVWKCGNAFWKVMVSSSIPGWLTRTEIWKGMIEVQKQECVNRMTAIWNRSNALVRNDIVFGSDGSLLPDFLSNHAVTGKNARFQLPTSHGTMSRSGHGLIHF